MFRFSKAWCVAALATFVPTIGWAQVTPAAGFTPPDDTPSIRVGTTLFADYTYTDSPEQTDADGNSYNPSQFNVSRAYINVTGNINHMIAFRFTPDITRAGRMPAPCSTATWCTGPNTPTCNSTWTTG